MEQLLSHLEAYGLSSSAARWILGVSICLIVASLTAVIKRVIVRNLEKLSNRPALFGLKRIAKVLNRTYMLFYVAVGFYAAGPILQLAEGLEAPAEGALLTVLFVQIGIWGTAGVRVFLESYRDRLDEDPSQTTGLSIIYFLGQVVVWACVLLLILDNLGFNVTTLLASLGIGGIAVALAAQNILGDLFASLSIVIDKPFEIGDFIIVGNEMGTVERVGLKTTRLRSLGGEQLIFSNQDLLQSRIQNYKRMDERRIRFEFGVVYQTAYEKLEKIPGIVEDVIKQQEKTRFDRAHFNNFADSSLQFEVVYYVLDPDYAVYMDIHQQILFGLFERFEEEHISFAYPTRTIYQKNERPQVDDSMVPEPQSGEQGTIAP